MRMYIDIYRMCVYLIHINMYIIYMYIYICIIYNTLTGTILPEIRKVAVRNRKPCGMTVAYIIIVLLLLRLFRCYFSSEIPFYCPSVDPCRVRNGT